MLSRRLLFLAVLLAGALVAPAGAQVIDDFEARGFTLLAPAGASDAGIQGSIPAFHCLAGERSVELSSNGPDPAAAQLAVSLLPDEVTTVFPQDGGSLRLQYDFPVPADITGGGENDRVRARVTAAPLGTVEGPFGFLALRIRDSVGNEAVGTRAVDGPGNYDFHFSVSWSGVDLADVELIEVALTTSDPGDFHLADLRTLRPLEETMLFEVVDPSASGPPYPSDLAVFDGLVPPDPVFPPDPVYPPDPVEPLHLEIHEMSLFDAEPHVIGVPDLRFDWTAAAPFTLTVDVLESEIFWSPDGVETFPDTARLTFSNVIAPASTTLTEITEARIFLHGASAVSKKAQVVHVDATSKIQSWQTEATLNAEVNPIQPIEIADAGVESVMGDEVQWFVTLVLQAAAQSGQATVDPAFALLRIDYTAKGKGSWWPVGVDEDPSPVPGRMLRVDPVVGRAGVVFHLGRTAATGGTEIEILDIRGRRVRILSVPAGATESRWDGRDAAGRPLAAGVYLARVPDRPGTTTKFVRLH